VANGPDHGDEPDLSTLVRGIVNDAETLIGQQFELLRGEIRQELGQAGVAALAMGSGAVLMATGGALAALMAVHGLHRATRLPLWACYGLLGGALGGVGFELLAAGRRRAAGVPLMPRQTVEALKENIAWLKDQAIPGAT
jgi:hypothetical protein